MPNATSIFHAMKTAISKKHPGRKPAAGGSSQLPKRALSFKQAIVLASCFDLDALKKLYDR
jgi:hypothetical protein